MGRRFLVACSLLSVSVVWLTGTSAAGQSQRTPTSPKPAAVKPAPSRTAKSWVAPRTPWGDPDLEGIWNNGTITPLERPKEYEGRETLTPDEIAKLEYSAATRDDDAPREGDVGF